MFTEIVQDLGTVTARDVHGVDLRIAIKTKLLALKDAQIGDSISVQGVCLTVTSLTGDTFTAAVSHETLSLTTLGELQIGASVNPRARTSRRRPPRRPSRFRSRRWRRAGEGDEPRRRFAASRCHGACGARARYISRKGSVTLDGVSLTVNEVEGATFGINLIPHTQQVTTLGKLQPGARLNLEVDQIARYVERLAMPYRA